MDIVQCLASEGADIAYTFTFLITNDEFGLARKISESGMNINQPNRQGETAIVVAVSQHNLEVVRALLELGVNAAPADSHGESILFLLLARDDLGELEILSIANVLLDNGAPVSGFNRHGRSTKSIARAKHYHELVELLDAYAPRHAPEPDVEPSTAS